MKTFVCHCGNTLYFENSRCLVCKRMVGYLPDDGMISALEPQDNGNWLALVDRHTYRMCKNYSDYNVCNWMVPAHDPHPYCLSCRLNHIIPNLGEGQNLTLWYRIESAKRRLLYTLYELHLPVIGRHSDPKKGLAFEFLADETSDNEFRNELIPDHHVITGHRGGIITINLREAEDSAREVMREKMNERYRTLLGHFRHEIGHYYWDRLIVDMDRVGEFRRIFGDERQDYEQSLRKYYQDGPPSDWQSIWISAYASSILKPRPEKRPVTRERTPGVLSTQTEIVCRGSISPLLGQQHLVHGFPCGHHGHDAFFRLHPEVHNHRFGGLQGLFDHRLHFLGLGGP